MLDLKIQNQALLLKYIHKFIHKADMPWVMLIWHKYYDDTPPHAKPRCGSFWWRDIFSLMDIYRGITSCVPGAGDTILLWKDQWENDGLMQDQHKRLFSFAINEDISLAQYMNDPDPRKNFHLPLSLEAREELQTLNNSLEGLILDPMKTDDWILCWGDTTFKPSKYYKFMFRNLNPPAHIVTIWKTKCMMRHKVFAWLMFMDRINTRDMLCRRHFNIGDDKSCLLCSIEPLETNKHLFFECGFSTVCWQILGINWNTEVNTQDMFDMAARDWGRPMFKETMILAAWNMWKQRNRHHFDKVVPTVIGWKKGLASDLQILKYRARTESITSLDSLITSLQM